MGNSEKRLTVKERLKKKVLDNEMNRTFDNSDELVQGNDADVNKDDLEALGPIDLSQDMGDDEDLKHRVYPLDFTGDDLDIPGVELDDDMESTGSEDEENNSYSIGGDAHDNLEETNNI